MELFDWDLTTLYVRKFVSGSIYTAMPAAITEVHELEDNQVISVNPLIKKQSEDGVVVDLPEVLDVPVVFPAGGGGLLSFPLAVGDQVLLVFSMRSISEYLEAAEGQNDRPYAPETGRNHHLTDAIAIPCMFGKNNNLSPNPDHVELKFAGSSVKLKDDGDVTVDAAKDLVATVAGNTTNNTTGNVEVTAGGTANIDAGGNVDIKSGGAATVEASSMATIKAPTITLDGIVNITGACNMQAGMSVTGAATNNGTNIGSTHTHGGSPTAPDGPVSNTGTPV